ncbi:MAG: electron transfer flavoprotein subunit beta/FixA family protein [Chloroflexi bacterium]|nr:electron transfer flavoprotein subunit beta/FixA family protein [Chloroflexota bacterium]
MKIVVCVKQVPDTAATMTVDNGVIGWGDAPLIINPWDEYAVEAALNLIADHGGDVTALCLGKVGETEAIKHALAMGVNSAVMVSDPALKGVDNVAASRVLAAAIQKIGEVDLVLFGQQSVDTDTGLLPIQIARLLKWPSLTLVSKFEGVSLGDGKLQVVRSMEEGSQVVDSSLPAVVSVTKDYAEPRYPSFMGIRKASKAEYPVWSLADLGIEAPISSITWPEVSEPVQKDIVTEIIEGGTPEEKAKNLVKKLIGEKVL